MCVCNFTATRFHKEDCGVRKVVLKAIFVKRLLCRQKAEKIGSLSLDKHGSRSRSLLGGSRLEIEV